MSEIPFWQKEKWQRKYLSIANTIAQDNDACYARKVGCVLVSPDNTIISMGYNGAFRGCPHPDSYEYLMTLWDRLTDAQQRDLFNYTKEKCLFLNYEPARWSIKRLAAERLHNCAQCPRRLLNIPSGEGRDICPCACSERNALNNANRSGVSTLGAVCFCTLHPCYNCAVELIQSGIKAVVYIDIPDNNPYIDKASQSFLEIAKVEVIGYRPYDEAGQAG